MKMFLITAMFLFVATHVSASQTLNEPPTSDSVQNQIGGDTTILINKSVSFTQYEEQDRFVLTLSGIPIRFGSSQIGTHEKSDERTIYSTRPHNRHYYRWYWKSYRHSYPALEFGYNYFLGADYSSYPPNELHFLDLRNEQSGYFAWNFLTLAGSLNRAGTLGVSVGLGMVSRDFVFSNKIRFVDGGNSLTYENLPASVPKTKLNLFSFRMPVMLSYRFPHTKLALSVGGYGELPLGRFTKTSNPSELIFGDYHLNDFHAGISAQVRLSWVSITANYGVVEFFKPQEGPKVHPFSIAFGFCF